MSEIYKQLARHLDGLPGGFPETESGIELKILRRLFTPEEAEMAVRMTLIPETAEDVARRTGLNPESVAKRLTEMSGKGLLLRNTRNGKTHFMAAQFVVGIWEYHVNDLDEELIADVNAYLPHLFKAQMTHPTQQLRVIPISKSISAEMQVMPYEVAEEIIRSQSKIIIAPCICRKEHKMTGKGCGRLEEACLVFGGGAYYYEENGLGRSIGPDEAIDILHKGMAEGLVLQPGNAQKPLNICMCCGCCCQILKNARQLENPAAFVHSNYRAEVDSDACIACGVCEDRCPMDAIAVADIAAVNKDRCIGCGVCVAGCETAAIHMIAKTPGMSYEPPKTLVHTFMSIAKERGLL